MDYVSNRQTAVWYGPPCKATIVRVRVAGSDVPVNKKAKRAFLFQELCFKYLSHSYWKHDLNERQLDDWGYLCRPTTGQVGPVTVDNASKHAFGLADDIDADENVRGSSALGSEIWQKAERAVRMLERTFFTWGGRFSTPDPHHFEVARPPSYIFKRLDRKGRPRRWYAKQIGWEGPVSTF
jgi:hypothetical protein